MKTFAEQVASLKATRLAKAEEMKAVAQKSVDESRSMNTAEAENFDTLNAEIKRLDDDIARLASLVEIEKASLVPVQSTQQNVTATGGATGGNRVPVQMKTVDNTEKGIGFARVARIKAISHLDHVDPMQVARSLYPNDQGLHRTFEKAAVGAMNTGNPEWGGNLILDGGSYFADFVEFLRASSVMGKIAGRLRNLPFDTPVLLQGSAGAAAWVGEGQAKPLTKWSYTRTKLEPLKVAAIAAATKEMIRRASTASDTLIRDELARACIAALDGTFVGAAAAVAGVSPAGIRNGVAAITLDGAGDVEGVRCDIAQMLKAMVTNNLSIAGSFWLMPETVAIELSQMTNLAGAPAFPGMTPTGGTLAGLEAYATQYVPANVVMLVKGDEIFLGDEGGIQVAMSDQASLVMDSAPTGDSTAPESSEVVSMFQTNSVAFLVERFMNWAKRRNSAVVWATVNWSSCPPAETGG